MARRLLALAACAPLALAYSNTLPVVSWSSHSTNILDLLPSSVVNVGQALEGILFHGNACDNDALILIDHPGLHASDLRNLPSSSAISQTLLNAPSSAQFPYVRGELGDSPSNAATSLAQRCGARVVNIIPGQGGVDMTTGEKHVVYMSLPELSVGAERKGEMLEHDSTLASELVKLTSIFPKHLVVYAGTFSSLGKRQIDEEDTDDFHILPFESVRVEKIGFAPSNSTHDIGSGGILAHYQLLTPGLITTLLVTFFILVPVVMLGINALSTIQSPIGGGGISAPKGYSATERKNQ